MRVSEARARARVSKAGEHLCETAERERRESEEGLEEVGVGKQRRQTLTSLFVLLSEKAHSCFRPGSVIQHCVSASQQHCQELVASNATNNAILYWADCVSPLVFLWARNVRLSTRPGRDGCTFQSITKFSGMIRGL